MESLATKINKVVFLLIVSALALCLSEASVVNAYNPTVYSQDDSPWFDSNHASEPTLFRELQIQLCSIGIWQITEGSNVDVGSGVNPFTSGNLYSGILGAPRPSGTQIVSEHGSGQYYFESYNSSGCGGIDDEPFGVSSWAYFTVNPDGSFVNAYIATTTSNINFIDLSATTSYQTRIQSVEINNTNSSANVNGNYNSTLTGNNPYTLTFTIPSSPSGTSGDSKIGLYSYDVDGVDSSFIDTCDGTIISPNVSGQEQYCFKTFSGAGQYSFEFTVKEGYEARSIFFDIANTVDANDWYNDILVDSESLFNENEVSLLPPSENAITITANYLLNTLEIISTISEKNPTLIEFELSKRPATTTFSQGETINNTQNGTSSVTTQFDDLADGTYDVLVKFSNAGCTLGLSQCPFPLAYVYTSFTVVGNEVTNVGTSEVYDNVVVAPSEAQYEDCGLTNIGGCINNSLRFLFIPSQSSVNALLETKDTLDTRIPFVYVSDIRTVADEIFNTAQAETLDVELDLGFGTIPFINEDMIASAPQASLIRTLLSYMLWIAFAMGAYRMALGIHNRETT